METLTRYARVIATDKEGNTVADVDSHIRLSFAFCWANESKAGECAIKIYNASDSVQMAIRAKGVYISLIAGTPESYGMVFHGTLVNSYTVQEEMNSVLIVNVSESPDFFSAYVKLSLNSGETVGGLLKKAVEGCSAPVALGRVPERLSKTVLPRGVSFIGSPITILDDVCRTFNCTYFVSHGILSVYSMDDFTEENPLDISFDNGLIHTPAYESYYATFQCLINSSLRPWRFVRMSDTGNGLFRILSATGCGDTLEGDWYMSVCGMAQNGLKAALTALTENIWR